MKEQYVTEVVSDRPINPLIDHNGTKAPKLTITFPVPIKQTDRNKVEIDLLERGPDPFSVEFTRHVVELMGSMGGEAFLDEMAELIGKRLIIRNLR